jgi:beta-glucosidase
MDFEMSYKKRMLVFRHLITASILLAAVPVTAQVPLPPQLGTRVVNVLRIDGLLFKDLNKNGKLDRYEDWRMPVDVRVDDLVAQMTIEEKAGLMVGPSLTVGPNNGVSEQPTFMVNPFNPGPPAMVSPATVDGLYKRHIRQFINRDNLAPKSMVNWLNAVQQLAEGSRLGIPVLFVTNPRNTYGAAAIFGITEAGSSFSQWPGTLGLAAMRDTALVEEFARMAAQEYVSVGLRGAYHPTADIGTEPRWGRFKETFGEDAALTTELITAYIRGFQGKSLGPHSVALVTKHFPGAGPASGGQDAHFTFGKNQVYPGKNLEYHLQPWRAAIREGTAMIMPYYAVPKGLAREEVGMSFNREIVTDLLRHKLGFQGVINSDTGISTSMPWGVENLSLRERYKKAIEAGVDRMGGDVTPEIIVDLVKSGELAAERIDQSAKRILKIHFQLGIFENPYSNPDEAARTVRRREFQEKADLAQRKSIVLLKNGDNILPLKPGTRMYVENIDASVAAKFGFVSTSGLDQADVAIVRVSSRRDAGYLGTNTGAPIDLTLPADQVAQVQALMRKRPTIVVVQFEKPYVIPELARESAALLATFGVSDEALFDVLTGRFNPTGKLPFELPSSMEAVRQQLEDLPYDSKDPLFPFGAGLSYQKMAVGKGR